jgi:uncharacterized membrane protein
VTAAPDRPRSAHVRAVSAHLAGAAEAAARRARLRRAARTPTAADVPTRGERAADRVTDLLGSWRFLIVQTAVLATWVLLNVTAWVRHWDPYPFILLNLTLSFQAAYTAPVLLMSANRQSALDRRAAELDHLVNERSEAEVEELLHLARAQLAQGAELLERVTVSGSRP